MRLRIELFVCSLSIRSNNNYIYCIYTHIHTYTYSWSQKFKYTLQNLQNVDYFTKIRGIIQNACFVYLVLTWIRYFTWKMFTCSPQNKIIVQKFTPPCVLNTVVFSEWSSAVFISLVIVVHESLVCPEQLNGLLFFRKILQLSLIIWFSSIVVYLNPFQQWLY